MEDSESESEYSEQDGRIDELRRKLEEREKFLQKLDDIDNAANSENAGNEEVNEDEEEEEMEEDNLLWNLNAVSIVSWRGNWLLNDQNNFKATMSSNFPLYLFRIVPLIIVVFEVMILFGIVDEGLQRKSIVEHDGIYQFRDLIWHKRSDDEFFSSAQLPTKLDPSCVDSANLTCATVLEPRIVFADGLLDDRPAAEVARCNDRALNTAIATQVTTGAGPGAPAGESPSYLFTHCLPWEYADVCVAILRADGHFDPVRVGTAKSVRYYCYLPATDVFGNPYARATLDNWAGLAVPAAEAAEAAAAAAVPKGAEGELDFGMWFVGLVINDAKTPDSDDDDLSLFLYIRSADPPLVLCSRSAAAGRGQ